MTRKEKSLRRRAEFRAVFERGRNWPGRLVALKTMTNHGGVSRFGYSVGKNVGAAVVRNRVRRRLKEVIHRVAVKPGWDVVVTARREAAGVDYHDLKEALETLMAKAHLLEDENERPGA